MTLLFIIVSFVSFNIGFMIGLMGLRLIRDESSRLLRCSHEAYLREKRIKELWIGMYARLEKRLRSEPCEPDRSDPDWWRKME